MHQWRRMQVQFLTSKCSSCAENSTEQREHLPGKDKPSCVHKAYLNQFEKDFTAILKSRSEEMIPGGCMVLTIYGRDENNDSSVKGSFTIKRLESFHVSWDASIDDRYRDTTDKYTKGKCAAKRIRAIMEAILARNFGDEIVDVMFQRFSIKIGESMETVNGGYNNHVVSMAKA
ncbi:hypothetical protein D5086_026942 [Populus alba]|uniref:Uncharacterized protein n=1 Tax=Populus alba TaxID=43335 RepID=A0ACC4B3A0_POPAL